jgi:hypothetical protein
MSIQEAAYWETEISDAELNLEADCGDFLLAAQALIQSARFGWESWA